MHPYSNFKVGAAIRAENGEVFTGCNVENVAYPRGDMRRGGCDRRDDCGG